MGRKVFIGAVSALVTLTLLESAARLWSITIGHPYSRVEALEQLAKARDAALGIRPDAAVEEDGDDRARWAISPYLGYDRAHAPERIDRYLQDLRDAGPETFHVMVLGGSVAANFNWHGKEPLTKALARDPRWRRKDLRFLQFARGAYKQPQQLITVACLFNLGLVPDAVLNIDGFNEVAIGAGNAARGVHPGQPSALQWFPLLAGTASDSRGWELAAEVYTRRRDMLAKIDAVTGKVALHSAVLGPRLLRRVDQLQSEYAQAALCLGDELASDERALQRRGPFFPTGEAEVLALCAQIWSESSLSIAKLCEARGVAYAHVLQPTLHDADSKPLTAREREGGSAVPVWVRAAHDGYPLLRAAGADLRKRGVTFRDGSQAFSEYTGDLYIDACHFDREGHALLAEIAAHALLDALEQ